MSISHITGHLPIFTDMYFGCSNHLNNNLFRIYYTHNLNHHTRKHLVLLLIFNLLTMGQLGYTILKTHKRYLVHPQLVYVFGFKLRRDKKARGKIQYCMNDFQIFQCDVQPQTVLFRILQILCVFLFTNDINQQMIRHCVKYTFLFLTKLIKTICTKHHKSLPCTI